MVRVRAGVSLNSPQMWEPSLECGPVAFPPMAIRVARRAITRAYSSDMTDSPGLRISVAERERALRELTHHLGTGRLSLDEFEIRSAAVAAADRPEQLAELFTDLPGAVPDSTPLGPPPSPLPAVGAGTVVVLGVVLALVFGSWWWLLLPIAAAAAAAVILRRLPRAKG
jgi:glycine/D-amino acid oxidase-like deaminating enzyme